MRGSTSSVRKGNVDLASHLLAQKHERMAREALYNLIALNDTLNLEIRRFQKLALKGIAVDADMLEKMQSVHQKYDSIMQGLRSDDETSVRHELIIYADAVQDLMTHFHKRKH